MKKRALCGLLVFLLSSSWAASAQQAPRSEEVGIDEKLGKTVPLELELVDEQGQELSLGQAIDKPTVLTLNYFRCGGICTPQLNNLARTMNDMNLEPGKDFQVVTVSFDSRDTAEVAARKRENYLKLMKRPFPPTAWRFLTGSAASTKALADAVGVSFKKQGEAFIHPGALILLSADGMVTRYLYGITYLPSDLDMAVNEASKGLVRPTISKALSFCFSYDPEGRKYVFNITRVAGLVTLALACVFLTVVVFRGRLRSRTERLSS